MVAWRLLYLTYRARLEPDLAASTCLSASELAVLAAKYGQEPRTLQEAIALVARLGGVRKSRRSAEPGVKALWEGLRDLERLVEGWELAFRSLSPVAPSYDTS